MNRSGGHLTPTGRRGKAETPQAVRRGGSAPSPRKASVRSEEERTKLTEKEKFIQFNPATSVTKHLQRKSPTTILKKLNNNSKISPFYDKTKETFL